jgi:hypothetical protein
MYICYPGTVRNFRTVAVMVVPSDWVNFARVAQARGTTRQALIREYIDSVLAQATPDELARPDGVAARCPVCGRESLDETEIGTHCGGLPLDTDTPCTGTLKAVQS